MMNMAGIKIMKNFIITLLLLKQEECMIRIMYSLKKRFMKLQNRQSAIQVYL